MSGSWRRSRPGFWPGWPSAASCCRAGWGGPGSMSTTRSLRCTATAKQGASCGYTRGLNMLLATARTAASGPVLVTHWLRKGSCVGVRPSMPT